jgi:hypothetical protein
VAAPYGGEVFVAEENRLGGRIGERIVWQTA